MKKRNINYGVYPFWIAGIISIFLGLGDYLRQTLIERPEKHAYYILGHWVDSLWTIQITLIVIGTISIIIGFYRRNRALTN